MLRHLRGVAMGEGQLRAVLVAGATAPPAAQGEISGAAAHPRMLPHGACAAQIDAPGFG